MNLTKIIRDVPDFPKKGILFKDITTLLKDKEAFRQAIDSLAEMCKNRKIDKIVSMESRGFIFGSVLAYKLNCGFVPIRKKGKLPHETIKVTYDLEYGTDTLEMHKDAIAPGENVLLVDDLLATGGTAQAVVKLINQVQGKVAGLVFLIELEFLKGREKLKGNEVFSLIKY
jgi:adenine phosphoribosyltransferase